MIPTNITKEHLEKAIQEIDKTGIRKGRHSSTYNLIYQGAKNGQSEPLKTDFFEPLKNRFRLCYKRVYNT